MIRKYLVLILVLGFLDLTCSSSQSCQDGFVFNPKRQRCEPQAPLNLIHNCQPGMYWHRGKSACIKIRQVISGFYPIKPENSTENLKCPKGFISIDTMCLMEFKEKKPAPGQIKDGLELDVDDNFKIVIKEKKPATPA